MFQPNQLIIEAFVDHCQRAFSAAFPNPEVDELQVLEQAVYTAVTALENCDCSYHDLQHTMLVTDAGLCILRGKQLARGDVTSSEWLHAVIAMLFHDIGYLRGLLAEDHEGNYIADDQGNRVQPPDGATDAYMKPFHVTRGCLYMAERFTAEPLVDVATVSSHIEMTRFPVPNSPFYKNTDSYGALVRAADLIGQMGDPLYMQKLSRLFAEFVEAGETSRLGFTNPGELRTSFPEFFYNEVYPYLSEALVYLRKTTEGREWAAHLFSHVHNEQTAEPAIGPERNPRPLEAVSATQPKPQNVSTIPFPRKDERP